MQEVVEYKLIAAQYIPALQGAVSRALEEGWVPSGPIVAFKDELIQTMVKFLEEV